MLGHELTHIINRDVRTMVIASIFAGIITLMCQIIYRSIMLGRRRRRGAGGAATSASSCWWRWWSARSATCWPSSSAWRSRARREYVADAGSVRADQQPRRHDQRAAEGLRPRPPGRAGSRCARCSWRTTTRAIIGLFATHPPVEKRIAALMQYAGGQRRGHAHRPAPTPNADAAYAVADTPAPEPAAPPDGNVLHLGRIDASRAPWAAASSQPGAPVRGAETPAESAVAGGASSAQPLGRSSSSGRKRAL